MIMPNAMESFSVLFDNGMKIAFAAYSENQARLLAENAFPSHAIRSVVIITNDPPAS